MGLWDAFGFWPAAEDKTKQSDNTTQGDKGTLETTTNIVVEQKVPGSYVDSPVAQHLDSDPRHTVRCKQIFHQGTS